MSDITADLADEVLAALGEQLAAGAERFELVVIGGSALLALGLIERTTKDVDIVALHSGGDLAEARPLPEALQAACAVDQGPGKHEQDLRALTPTPDELRAAADWSRTQDPSEGYAQVLRGALATFGVEDAAR